MSRKLGAFDPASTATTTVVALSTAASAGIAAVAQNMFPLSTDLSNTGAGDGVLSTLGTVITFSSAVGTPYGPGSALRIQDSSSTRNKLEITSAGAVEMMEFSSAFTWEWWMWRDSGQNDTHRTFFDSRQNGQHSYPVLLIQFTTGGFLRIANSSTGSGSYQARTAGTGAAEQQWQHFAISRDSTDTLRIFLDGVKVLATSFAFSFDNKATSGKPEFFSDVNVTNNVAHYMRDLRIFKDTCVYTTAFTAPNQPMTATTETIVIATQTTVDTRSHSHVWNYEDVYTARAVDTWPSRTVDTQYTSIYLPLRSSIADEGPNSLGLHLLNSPTITSAQSFLTDPAASLGLTASSYSNRKRVRTTASSVFAFGSEDFTISLWYYALSRGGGNPTVFCVGDVSNNSIVLYDRPNSNSTKFDLRAPEIVGGAAVVESSITVSNDQWYHIAVTRQSDLIRLFVDGNLEDSHTYSGSVLSSAEIFSIGEAYQTGGATSRWTNNYTQDVFVAKGFSLYNASFTRPLKPNGGGV